MIFWISLWIIIGACLLIIIPMEIINGSLEWRFWICVILILFLIISPIFVCQAHENSKHFYESYVALENRVQNLSENQEYMVLGEAMNYNYYLYQYQTKIHNWGIFSPYYRDIKTLKPIQLKTFDMSNYRWWDS